MNSNGLPSSIKGWGLILEKLSISFFLDDPKGKSRCELSFPIKDGAFVGYGPPTFHVEMD